MTAPRRRSHASGRRSKRRIGGLSRQTDGKKKGAVAVATTPSLVVGAGPWMLKNHTWKYRNEIDLVPNPYYYRAKSFKIKEIHILFTGSVNTELSGYKSGEFPQTALPAVEVKKYRGTPEFRETVILGDVWYAMNVHIKPFTDVHFRRAVACANQLEERIAVACLARWRADEAEAALVDAPGRDRRPAWSLPRHDRSPRSRRAPPRRSTPEGIVS